MPAAAPAATCGLERPGCKVTIEPLAPGTGLQTGELITAGS